LPDWVDRLQEGDSNHLGLLPNQRLKLPPPALGRVPFVPQRTDVLENFAPFARQPGRRSLSAIR
jgi:hypothetical protein